MDYGYITSNWILNAAAIDGIRAAGNYGDGGEMTVDVMAVSRARTRHGYIHWIFVMN